VAPCAPRRTAPARASTGRSAGSASVRSLEARGVFAIIETDTEDEAQCAVRTAQQLGGHLSRAAAIDAALDYYLSTVR